MAIEPPWLTKARKHIGLREIKGPKHNSVILGFWKMIKRGGIKDDETPWCAAFVGNCLEAVGIMSSRYESAKSYLTWGQPVLPVVGCIAVFSREGGGHVGFVVGRDSNDRVLVLGGNQGDEVNIKAFDRSRVVSYRWPNAVPVPIEPLPVLAATGVSTNEA